jgi:hypothetical protein
MMAPTSGRTASAVRLFFLAALGALSVGLAAAQQPAFAPRDEAPEEFPDAPGREETFYTCSACHAFKLVAQQGMSRQRWDGTLDLMVNLHGMAPLERKDREAVLDYLERAFPERAPAAGGWQNPFLKN